VALPLLRLYAQLPAYSKATLRVSERAAAVRQALREARFPDELLFERLPAACGLPPFRAGEQRPAGNLGQGEEPRPAPQPHPSSPRLASP